MGVMDNMLHTESARVVTSSSGIHSEGRLGKLPMENGHYASRAGSPKYKRRRVSAVRDFPPGCGWFAPPINLRPSQEAASIGMVENSLGGDKSGNALGSDCSKHSETVVALQSPRMLQSSVPTEMLSLTNHLESGAEKPQISSDQVDELGLASAKPTGIPLPKIEPVESLECEITDMSKDLHQVDVAAPKEELVPSSDNLPIAATSGNGLEKNVTKNYPPRRKVSAIRDFPPFCGRNAPRLGKEECGRVLSFPKNQCLSPEKAGVQDKSLQELVKTDVKHMAERADDGDAHKDKLNANDSRLTGDKVQAESEGCATKEMSKQDELGVPCEIEMMVALEDIRGKCIEPPHGSNQYEFDLKSETVVQRGKFQTPGNTDVGGLEENLVKDVVAYSEDKSLEKKLSDRSRCKNQLQEEGSRGLELASDRVIVQGLMSASNCPWRQRKGAYKPTMAGAIGKSKGKKHDFILLKRPKSAFRTKKNKAENSAGTCSKTSSSPTGKACQGRGQLVIWNKDDSLEHDGVCENFHVVQAPHNFDVSLPPSLPSNSSSKHDDNDATATRNKVRETLRLFQAVFRKLLQEEEAKPKKERGRRRVDYIAAKILKDNGKYVNTGVQIIGSVPGVEVGDEFQYRVELNIIGLHRQTQGGIDYVKQGGTILATSIVASGGYDDDLDNSDVLTYTGQGGNVMNGDKEPEDQKLERGNLALANSKRAKNPVRVVRGETKASDPSDARVKTYIYDGLYLVEECRQDMGPHGKLVFRFQLRRIPGQPELAWKVVKKSKKSKVREGLCVGDISQGKELIPICAVNTVDDEKPPPFEYITSMIYPDWCNPIPPKGCDCTNACSESGKCSCSVKNGGEIPYNYNGAIVEAKPLVYECGPLCKCPPSCYNRVTQRGIKFHLEIFKTKSRGWGVRSVNSIPSGSFICEYAGELLEEKEAEKRTGNDEYLFDIGNNYNDISLWDGLSTLMPDAHLNSYEVVEGGGFTIDAARYGNVGRFINHSCSPNLYAQNVLYDHEDKRIPHIMLFAAENIPPLQELTYHYNYMIDQVRDSDGNIKKKSCYCGSSECTGRMY